MRNNIYKSAIPEDSIVRSIGYSDFSDCFGMQVNRKNVSVDEVVQCFFTTSPAFVTRLMQLRDFLARFAGLKTNRLSKEKKVVFEPGKEMGLFKMYTRNNHEVILGADDKHLDFRVSLYVRPGKDLKTELLISTVVRYHNKFGNTYMKMIHPFHKMVVKGIMENMNKTLSEDIRKR